MRDAGISEVWEMRGRHIEKHPKGMSPLPHKSPYFLSTSYQAPGTADHLGRPLP